MTNAIETEEIEWAECEGCGSEVPADELEGHLVRRATLESPAEYVGLCAACQERADEGPDPDDARDRELDRDWD